MIAFSVRGYIKRALYFLCLSFSFVFLIGSIFKTPQIIAAEPTPTVEPTPTSAVGPNVTIDAQWAFDPETTEVGKNADRARQLLWWVFSHPPVHWAPVLATVWAYSRNIMYVFIVIVIVTMGLGIILSRRGSVGPIFSGISSPTGGINITGILYKLGILLIYVTFSYIFILGMIQISEVIMRFFIDNVGGKDLFNVIFYGAGNSEANYTTFIGYRDVNPINQEMANTSLFLIRTTSLTYFAMSIILILRTIILWFLMVVSPFLALLMPFIFIRNTGWIWIGVFFQWLFYGPLMALFLATLTRIWVAGIPFMFDFSRVNKPEGQVYRTAINILYGGPAQTLGPGNTANYVDTFAEYVIALVMLWAAIILPWWLLRIFRDYCCSLLASANATMQSILDRMRQYPPPSPPSPVTPTSITGMVTELPFRQHIEERVKEYEHKQVDVMHSIKIENTIDIARSIDMAVSSLADISRMEMDKNRRVQVKDNLTKLAAPEKITSPMERQKFTNMKTALQTKAASGDMAAKTILNASQGSSAVNSNIDMMVSGRSSVASVGGKRGAFAPTIPSVLPSTSASSQSSVASISNIAGKLGVSESKVKEVLREVQMVTPLTPASVNMISQKTNVSAQTIQQIVSASQSTKQVAASDRKQVSTAKTTSKVPVTIEGQKVETQVSVEDYEEVKKMWLTHYREAPVPESDVIKTREQWIETEEKQLSNISNLLVSSDPKQKQKGLEQVAEILPFMLLGGFSDIEVLTYIKAKLEAIKQVQTELEITQKAKEEAKKEIKEEKKEEEETLLEVTGKKKEAEKHMEESKAQEMDLPKEEIKTKSDK